MPFDFPFRFLKIVPFGQHLMIIMIFFSVPNLFFFQWDIFIKIIYPKNLKDINIDGIQLITLKNVKLITITFK